jgi:hypothetical protein
MAQRVNLHDHDHLNVHEHVHDRDWVGPHP